MRPNGSVEPPSGNPSRVFMGADSSERLAGQGSTAITCQVKTLEEFRRFREEEIRRDRRSGGTGDQEKSCSRVAVTRSTGC
jgi:hypothetical protein